MSAKLNSCHITNILHASAQLISSEAVSLRILLERTLEHVFGRTSQTLLAAGLDLKSKPLAEEVQGVNDQTDDTRALLRCVETVSISYLLPVSHSSWRRSTYERSRLWSSRLLWRRLVSGSPGKSQHAN